MFDGDEQKLLNTITNVINTKDGFDFFCFLLDELKTFDKGSNFNSSLITFSNNAIRSKGQYILELVLKADFDKYVELLRKRKEDLCQTKNN